MKHYISKLVLLMAVIIIIVVNVHSQDFSENLVIEATVKFNPFNEKATIKLIALNDVDNFEIGILNQQGEIVKIVEDISELKKGQSKKVLEELALKQEKVKVRLTLI